MSDPFILIALAAGTSAAAIILVSLRPKWLVPLLAVAGVLSLRPTFIGERLPYLGVALILLAAVGALYSHPQRSNRSPILFFSVIFSTAYFWLAVHESTVPGSEPNLVSVLLTTALPVLVFTMIARNSELLRSVIKGLSITIGVVAILSVLSFALGLVLGFGATFVGHIPLGYVGRDIGVLLPGGFTYGSSLDGALPRMLGLGREPGMGAIFYVWAFFALPAIKHRWILRMFLMIGLLTTQSTAGVGLFAGALVAWVILGRDRIRVLPATVVIVLGATLLWVALYNPTFGILAKSETQSFNERNAATDRGWDALQHNFWDSTTDFPLSNVTLVASAAAHGGLWVILVATLLLLSLLAPGRTNPLTYAAAFTVATFLSSQPFVDSAGAIVLMMIGVASRTNAHAESALPRTRTGVDPSPLHFVAWPRANSLALTGPPTNPGQPRGLSVQAH